MEALFGFVGHDFSITVSDDTAARSICVQKRHHDKSVVLNKFALLSYNGDPGDAVQFAEYIKANISLYSISNGVNLSVQAAANFTRRQLADALRTKVLFIDLECLPS